MKFYKLLILILATYSVFAQRENENWIFYQNNQWKFHPTSGVLTNLLFSSPSHTANQGYASISDSNTGNLLFYSDGLYIYNKNKVLMETSGGLNLNGSLSDVNIVYSSSMSGSGNGLSTDQPVIIVPHPGNTNLYYIFFNGNYNPKKAYLKNITIADENFRNSFGSVNLGLQYSIVDMSYNGGLGKVTSLGNMLLTGVSEGLTSTLHYDGNSYWIVTQKGSSFYTYEINSSGLNTTPVISNVSPHNFGDFIKVSPNSERLFSNNILYDFNNLTGQVSNPLDFMPVMEKAYYTGDEAVYAEFSPNSNILYFIGSESNMCLFPCGRWTSGILMYNIQTGELAGYNSGNYTFPMSTASLQLAPNNKIYLTFSTHHHSNNFGMYLVEVKDEWAVIENPNVWNPLTNPVSLPLSSSRYLSYSFPQLIPTPPACPTNLIITNPITTSNDFQVSNKIEASSIVYQNLNVNFRGSQIILKPGFSVSGYNTGVFRAVVDPCSAGLISPIKEKSNFMEDRIAFDEPMLYPNPTTTILNIDNIADIQEWKLVDINGKIVESGKINNSIQTKITINTSRLVPGVYYFNAVMKNGELFQKTVMKK